MKQDDFMPVVLAGVVGMFIYHILYVTFLFIYDKVSKMEPMEDEEVNQIICISCGVVGLYILWKHNKPLFLYMVFVACFAFICCVLQEVHRAWKKSIEDAEKEKEAQLVKQLQLKMAESSPWGRFGKYQSQSTQVKRIEMQGGGTNIVIIEQGYVMNPLFAGIRALFAE